MDLDFVAIVGCILIRLVFSILPLVHFRFHISVSSTLRSCGLPPTSSTMWLLEFNFVHPTHLYHPPPLQHPLATSSISTHQCAVKLPLESSPLLCFLQAGGSLHRLQHLRVTFSFRLQPSIVACFLPLRQTLQIRKLSVLPSCPDF